MVQLRDPTWSQWPSPTHVQKLGPLLLFVVLLATIGLQGAHCIQLSLLEPLVADFANKDASQLLSEISQSKSPSPNQSFSRFASYSQLALGRDDGPLMESLRITSLPENPLNPLNPTASTAAAAAVATPTSSAFTSAFRFKSARSEAGDPMEAIKGESSFNLEEISSEFPDPFASGPVAAGSPTAAAGTVVVPSSSGHKHNPLPPPPASSSSSAIPLSLSLSPLALPELMGSAGTSQPASPLAAQSGFAVAQEMLNHPSSLIATATSLGGGVPGMDMTDLSARLGGLSQSAFNQNLIGPTPATLMGQVRDSSITLSTGFTDSLGDANSNLLSVLPPVPIDLGNSFGMPLSVGTNENGNALSGGPPLGAIVSEAGMAFHDQSLQSPSALDGAVIQHRLDALLVMRERRKKIQMAQQYVDAGEESISRMQKVFRDWISEQENEQDKRVESQEKKLERIQKELDGLQETQREDARKVNVLNSQIQRTKVSEGLSRDQALMEEAEAQEQRMKASWDQAAKAKVEAAAKVESREKQLGEASSILSSRLGLNAGSSPDFTDGAADNPVTDAFSASAGPASGRSLLQLSTY